MQRTARSKFHGLASVVGTILAATMLTLGAPSMVSAHTATDCSALGHGPANPSWYNPVYDAWFTTSATGGTVNTVNLIVGANVSTITLDNSQVSRPNVNPGAIIRGWLHICVGDAGTSDDKALVKLEDDGPSANWSDRRDTDFNASHTVHYARNTDLTMGQFFQVVPKDTAGTTFRLSSILRDGNNPPGSWGSPTNNLGGYFLTVNGITVNVPTHVAGSTASGACPIGSFHTPMSQISSIQDADNGDASVNDGDQVHRIHLLKVHVQTCVETDGYYLVGLMMAPGNTAHKTQMWQTELKIWLDHGVAANVEIYQFVLKDVGDTFDLYPRLFNGGGSNDGVNDNVNVEGNEVELTVCDSPDPSCL